jgi:lysyl endopeptidase
VALTMRTLALMAAAFVSLASAQVVPPKSPARLAETDRASRAEARPPGLRSGMPRTREFSLTPLSETERQRVARPDTRLKTGVHRALPSATLASGAWDISPEGVRVWRVSLRSPGATGIRLEFTNFDIADGKVWLHDGAQAVGPYTGRGLYDDGHFWSGSIFAESVTVEYEPGSAATGTRVPFEIRAISHELPRAAVYSSSMDPADYCHLDPNCYTEWQPAMSMVAAITFEQDGLRYACTGSLVATRDNSFIPYLLTAGHCIHSEETARTVEVYWTYQTSSCGGAPPASRAQSSKSTVGGHLVASGSIEDGDYSLVLLKDVPGGTTFSGWDAGVPQMDSPLVGIHHPKGSWKRISFGTRVGDQTVMVENDVAPAPEYLQVLWDKGTAEQGSSGSPLFSSPGVIVGTLSYGPSSPYYTSCQMSPLVNGYGRFSNTYSHLKDYLENLPAALVVPEKADASFVLTRDGAPATETVRLTTGSTGEVSYKLRADASWIQLSGASGTVSAKQPAPFTVTVDPAQFDEPGQYASTVTVLSGSAQPQFLNVTVKVAAAQSNVAASITPSVVNQAGGRWSFTIRLSETAGADTRLTSLKMNGADYSAAIAGWFGGDAIPAKGSIEAPLEGSGRFPAGAQYFEFWGVDANGQHWYRTTTVEFR